MNNEDIKEYIDKFIKPAQKRDLLDYFAGQALIAELINEQLYANAIGIKVMASRAYNYAEAMLQEREKRIGGQDETKEEKETS